MPALIEFRLQVTRPMQATTRQLHGLACAIFEGNQSADHTGQDKPFSVWPLQILDDEPAANWLLRTAWLRPGMPQAALSATGQLRIGHVACTVTDVACELATHADLATGPAVSSAEVEFHSPTYFSQNSTDTVVPDPRLILGSWWRRWTASLPDQSELAISEETWRETHRATRLTSFDMRTENMDSGRGHDRSGFTGTATLELTKEASSEMKKAFSTLTRFATFSGTGAQTTHGFGATSVTT
jgi:hypothetical protein